MGALPWTHYGKHIDLIAGYSPYEIGLRQHAYGHEGLAQWRAIPVAHGLNAKAG
jgi:hypothetical protein